MSFTQKDLIIAYRKDGMSYREIAEKTHTTEDYCRTVWSRANREIRVIPAVPDFYKDCRYCGKPLEHTPGAKKKQFCDDTCRNKFHNQLKLKKAYVRTCEHCGSEFIAYGYPKKRFCSRDCQTAASRKKKE